MMIFLFNWLESPLPDYICKADLFYFALICLALGVFIGTRYGRFFHKRRNREERS